jgi:hypothetical protein
MSILPLAAAFLAAFVATLLVCTVVPAFAKALLVAAAPRRSRSELAGALALAAQPDAISLVPTRGEPWQQGAAAEALVAGLLREGFRSAGVFSIPELPGVLAQLFAHPDEKLAGAVYEHPAAGHWIDVVEHRGDGTSTTWTTARPSGLDPRPGHPQVHAPGLSPGELMARVRRERGAGPVELVHVAEVEALVERAWADEMAWRKSRGVERAEVRRVERALHAAA